jgi:hypothetical protein
MSFAFREMSGTTTPSITTERTSELDIELCCAESGNRQRVAMLSAVASLSGIVHWSKSSSNGLPPSGAILDLRCRVSLSRSDGFRLRFSYSRIDSGDTTDQLMSASSASISDSLPDGDAEKVNRSPRWNQIYFCTIGFFPWVTDKKSCWILIY